MENHWIEECKEIHLNENVAECHQMLAKILHNIIFVNDIFYHKCDISNDYMFCPKQTM